MVPLNINIRDSTLHCSPSRSHPRISLPCPSFFFLAGPGHLHEIAVFLLSGRSRSPTRNRCFSLFAKSTGPVQILFHSNPIGISPCVPPNSLCFLALPFYPCFYFGPGMGEGERGGPLRTTRYVRFSASSSGSTLAYWYVPGTKQVQQYTTKP